MKIYNLDEAPKYLEKMTTPYSEVFGSLRQRLTIEVYEPGEEIIAHDRPITRLRFLVDGRAKISLIHENGNRSIVHFVSPGQFVGELTFLEIEKEHKTIHGISKCTFLSVDMDQARRILGHDAEFLFKLSQFIGDKMLRRTSFNAKNQNYELRHRLAAYILATQHKGIYLEKHTETAEYLAVSYRHLLHTLKAFQHEGLLEKLKKGYKVHEEGLEALAKDITIF